VHAQTELEKHPWSFARDILVGITSSSWTDQATWSTFAIAAAGIIGIFLLFYKETSEKRNRAESIGNAGKVPTFRLPEGANETPSDREIYYSYQCRIATDEERAKMPIHELPVYFLIPPQKGRSFRAIVSSERKQPASNLPSDAAGLGLDWSGFTAWRWDAYCTDYALKANGAENNLRCVSNPRANPKAGEYIIPGSRCLYTDYVVRELSVNLCAPGTLPDMRRLFEGPQWDEGTLDLSDCSAGASRYSLRISVTGILLTQDEYFVLQRRSTRVASGIGSLGASVAGAADFQKDRYGLMIPRIRPRRWNLEKSIRRELKEETGIKNLRESLHPGPFLGAALNLRYGRDLNFYALLQTPENTWDLSAYRKKRAARDRWEVDRLEFLDSRLVTQRSILRGELELHLPGRSRHLMGALYAWTVFADKK
jgi:8-oxo-dGTP pyrophosphatase MutT (NUDIX family)